MGTGALVPGVLSAGLCSISEGVSCYASLAYTMLHAGGIFVPSHMLSVMWLEFTARPLKETSLVASASWPPQGTSDNENKNMTDNSS